MMLSSNMESHTLPLTSPPYRFRVAVLSLLGVTSMAAYVDSVGVIIPPPWQSQMFSVALPFTSITVELRLSVFPFRQRLTVPLMVISHFTLISSPR